jgi:hypothetical protein
MGSVCVLGQNFFRRNFKTYSQYREFQQFLDPGDVRSFGLSARFPIFVITYMEISPSVVLSLYMLLWALTIVRGAPEQLVYEMLSPHVVAFFAFFHPPAVQFVPAGSYHPSVI